MEQKRTVSPSITLCIYWFSLILVLTGISIKLGRIASALEGRSSQREASK